MHVSRRARAVGAALLALGAAAAALAACSSGSGSSSASALVSGRGGTYTFWDPYPQYNASSAWAKLVETCGTQAGVTIKRTGYDTTALTTQALLAAPAGQRRPTSCSSTTRSSPRSPRRAS